MNIKAAGANDAEQKLYELIWQRTIASQMTDAKILRTKVSSGVINDVEDGKKVLGYPAVDARDALKQWAVVRRLARGS